VASENLILKEMNRDNATNAPGAPTKRSQITEAAQKLGLTVKMWGFGEAHRSAGGKGGEHLLRPTVFSTAPFFGLGPSRPGPSRSPGRPFP